MEAAPQPKIKHKSFSYTTNLMWVDGRIGTLTSAGKPSLQISSPPEFKGSPGYWTPEDVFVGSVEMCQMLTFIGIAGKQGVPFISYKSSAKGTLEFIDGQYRFTRIVIVPVIAVEEPGTESQISAILREAHKKCLIANSISAIVEVNPQVEVREKTAQESV